MKGSLRSLLVAAVAAAALALPAGASGASRISLAITPGTPAAATPFEIGAGGVADRGDGGRSFVIVVIGSGRSKCAPTPGFERVSSNGRRVIFESTLNGPFTIARAVRGDPFEAGDGLPGGSYRACGYVTDQAGDFRVQATTRKEFTVGGTCRAARSRLARAKRRLRSARRALRRARRSGSARRVRRAKRSVRRAKTRVRTATAERKRFC